MATRRTYLLTYLAFLVGTISILAIVALVFHFRENASPTQAPGFRQHLLADMTAHCLKGARTNHDNQPDQKNIDFCNCAMSRAFAQISDADLAAMNSSSFNRIAIHNKMEDASASCRAEIFPGK